MLGNNWCGNVSLKTERADVATLQPNFETFFVEDVLASDVSHNVSVFNWTKANGARRAMHKIFIRLLVLFFRKKTVARNIVSVWRGVLEHTSLEL